MSRRRKHFNEVNAPSLARWIVFTGLIAVIGLVYVYQTIQLYHLGDSRKALETEVTRLRTAAEVANAQIAALTSRPALQRRQKEGSLHLVPIEPDNIVRLTIPSRASGDDEIQPVANPRPRR